MERSWTFGQKVGAAFALNVLFTLLVGLVAIQGFDEVSAVHQRVLDEEARALTLAERLNTSAEAKISAARGLRFAGEARYVQELDEARTRFADTVAELERTVSTEEARQLVRDIDRAEADHQLGVARIIELRRAGASEEDLDRTYDAEVTPRRNVLSGRVEDFVAYEQTSLTQAIAAADDQAAERRTLMIGLIVAAAVLASVAAFFLSGTLSRQVGTAVQRMRSSSAELQTAANQQVTGTREQATAMTEITTTINELLATSRQIAESAQRVAHIAGETAAAARAGDQTSQRAQDSIGSTKRQVDAIVTHMLDLGRKSQQIGGILEIVTELSDQTNILAINATIEAAGAGEAGRRFGVVADEIRKLADRVGSSTKEIRGLIEEVRAAVNTTVMATEGGSKAADAGARQFAEVAAALAQIGGLVGTTTDAAREIELSTRQQATAVEQVNIAIVNVAQATRETEASSGQTLQTASELARVSLDLARIVQSADG